MVLESSRIYQETQHAAAAALDGSTPKLKVWKVSVDMERWRPRIEHSQIMTQGDLERVGTLGVISSVQPTHAYVPPLLLASAVKADLGGC